MSIQNSETCKCTATDQRRGGGRSTNFDKWSECPLSTDSIFKNNRKRYPNVKSRYMEPGRSAQKSRRGCKINVLDTNENCRLLKQERDRLTSFDPMEAKRMTSLSPCERVYLDMVEAGGRLDNCASVLGLLIAAEIEHVKPHRWSMTVPSMIQTDVRLLEEMKRALITRDNDFPAALLRMAFVFTNDENWRWVIELCLIMSLSLQANGSHSEAICLFVAGQFYATNWNYSNWSVSQSAWFLERARRTAESHRQDWSIPASVRNVDWVRVMNDTSVWAAVCFAEYKVLLDAANTLDPGRALLAVQAASRLLELCCPRDKHHAAIEYELGVKYVAAGQLDKAVGAFSRCADMVTAMGADEDSDLHLEARLEAAKVRMISGKMNDLVFEWVVNQALNRLNYRLLVKAITAQGHANAYNGMPRKAYRRFALAYRLVVPSEYDDWDTSQYGNNIYVNEQEREPINLSPKNIVHRATLNDDENNVGSIITTYGDEEDVDTVRLYAAVCRTCIYLQSHFKTLSVRKFNLLDNATRWTGDQNLLIIRDGLNNQIFLNPDRFQDACVNSEAREIHKIFLAPTIDYGRVKIAKVDPTKKLEELQKEKKQVMFQLD